MIARISRPIVQIVIRRAGVVIRFARMGRSVRFGRRRLSAHDRSGRRAAAAATAPAPAAPAALARSGNAATLGCALLRLLRSLR